jgi:DNA-binding XRE family transcriptional regulator
MSGKRVHRKIERPADEQQRHRDIRARFRRGQPSLETLIAGGDATGVVSQGEYLDLREMLVRLKKHREEQGLSLADISKRCGMDRSAVSRLENGVYVNPTLDTLSRYAEAVGVEIGFSVRVPAN